MLFIARSLELQALPYALNTPPRAAASFNYQLQASADLNAWTNCGTPFTATNNAQLYPGYWDVASWERLFFRLQQLSP
jgi:hypothetical protein